MYSVILMAALTTSTAEAPAFGHRSCGCCGGMFVHSGCYGCAGCSGGWAGWGSCYGCSGCYGCMGCYGVYSGCVGCYGGWFAPESSGWGSPIAPAGNPMMTAPGTTPPTTPGTPTTPPATGTKPPTGTSAKVIIEKPVDAKIYVDNQLVKSEGARQTFVTPVLNPAQAYYYTVRVEAVRDGKPTSETRRVIVRSGETAQETFTEPAVVTAAK